MADLVLTFRYNVNDENIYTSVWDVVNRTLSTINVVSNRIIENIDIRDIYQDIRSVFINSEQDIKVSWIRRAFIDSVDYLRTNYRSHAYHILQLKRPIENVLSLTGTIRQPFQSARSIFDYRTGSLAFTMNRGPNAYPSRYLKIPFTVGRQSAPYGVGFFTGGYVGSDDWWNNPKLDDFFRARYVSGYDKILDEVKSLIDYSASLRILENISGSVLGPGLHGRSVSGDGLSQNFSGGSSAEGGGVYGSTIRDWKKKIEMMRKELHSMYGGSFLTV